MVILPDVHLVARGFRGLPLPPSAREHDGHEAPHITADIGAPSPFIAASGDHHILVTSRAPECDHRAVVVRIAGEGPVVVDRVKDGAGGGDLFGLRWFMRTESIDPMAFRQPGAAHNWRVEVAVKNARGVYERKVIELQSAPSREIAIEIATRQAVRLVYRGQTLPGNVDATLVSALQNRDVVRKVIA